MNPKTGRREGQGMSTQHEMSDIERRAVARVYRARVRAPESAILAWVRSGDPKAILSASLADIRAVARAF